MATAEYRRGHGTLILRAGLNDTILESQASVNTGDVTSCVGPQKRLTVGRAQYKLSNPGKIAVLESGVHVEFSLPRTGVSLIEIHL